MSRLTADELKYAWGTKVKNNRKIDIDGKVIPIGTLLILEKSSKYQDCYEFKGYKHVGWSPFYIEDEEFFEVITTITNWKDEFEGK